MYQRKVRPYQFGLPEIPQTRPMMGQGVSSQTTGPQQDRQQQQMPNIPSGILEKMLKPAPYSMGSELPTGQGLLDSYIAGYGPSSVYAGAAADAAPSIAFSTPYLDSLAGGYESLMPASEAFSLGSAGTGAASGFGMGAGEAGLLGSGAASGAATGATAAGEAGAAGSAASSAGFAGPWAPITLAAMLAKSQVQGSDPGSAAGVADTLLLPSIDQWMANPGRSLGNTLDPIGTALGDVTGVGDDSWFSFLSPSGIFGGLFG